jgi:hypothetical protein
MTRNTTTSTTRRAAVGLIALGLLLSGCAAGSAAEVPTPTATATPAPDPKEIAADLAATFPTEAEWLENYLGGKYCVAITAGPSSCGGEEWPRPGVYSNGVNLREGVTSVTAQAVILAVDEFESDEAAQNSVDEAEAADLLFTGDFDLPMEGNSVGSRGTGTLVDFERAGWAGYRMSQVSVNTGPGGVAEGAEHSTTAILTTNGSLVFTFRVYYAAPDAAEAEVNGWLDRVFGPVVKD